jgi:hypothetical protein
MLFNYFLAVSGFIYAWDRHNLYFLAKWAVVGVGARAPREKNPNVCGFELLFRFDFIHFFSATKTNHFLFHKLFPLTSNRCERKRACGGENETSQEQ